MDKGVKYDTGKNLWNLLPLEPIQEIVKVLTFGAQKYSPDNWKKVPDAKERYYSAMMRHVVAFKLGERNDPETGYNHLAHAGCCLIFWMWFEIVKEKVNDKPIN